MDRRIILIRHAVVPEPYRSLCYGQSDVVLDDAGVRQSRTIADVASQWPITHLYSSDLCRAAHLANAIAERGKVPVQVDARLRERHFGEWELVKWDDIATRHVERLHALVQRPDQFAPPGGETTFQHRDRILDWYHELPPSGFIVAVTHGGTIAVLLGALQHVPVPQWPALVPEYGAIVEVR